MCGDHTDIFTMEFLSYLPAYEVGHLEAHQLQQTRVCIEVSTVYVWWKNTMDKP